MKNKENEISCENCKHCKLRLYLSGKWYCSQRSVFDTHIEIEECFEKRTGRSKK